MIIINILTVGTNGAGNDNLFSDSQLKSLNHLKTITISFYAYLIRNSVFYILRMISVFSDWYLIPSKDKS